MSDITSKISLFHNLYLICLVISMLCLVISIIFFIKSDIPGIISFFSGSREKKEIEKLQKEGFSSRQSWKAESRTSDIEKKTENYKTADIGTGNETVPIALVTERLERETCEETEDLGMPWKEGEQTTLLQNDPSLSMFYIEREILLIHTDEIIE